MCVQGGYSIYFQLLTAGLLGEVARAAGGCTVDWVMQGGHAIERERAFIIDFYWRLDARAGSGYNATSGDGAMGKTFGYVELMEYMCG